MGNVVSSLKLDLEDLGLTDAFQLLGTEDQNYPQLNKQYFAQEVKKNMSSSPNTNIDIELEELLNKIAVKKNGNSNLKKQVKTKANKLDKPKARSKNGYFKDEPIKPFIKDQTIDKILSSGIEFSDKTFPATVIDKFEHYTHSAHI